MNLLVVGVGAGSWDVRGRQLGGALGARVTMAPSDRDFGWADLIVLVKRAVSRFSAEAKRSGKPVIWDALDFWAQPAQNGLTRTEAVELVRRFAWPGLAMVGATQAMAADIGGAYLPHHAWPGLTPAPARDTVRTVAYQGAAHYLGRWAGWLSEACAARGWEFVVNPKDLREADILVAFRDGEWDGWICREWKSGVKCVNALAAGRPIVTQDAAAFREIRPEGSVVFGPTDLAVALDYWAAVEVRQRVAESALERARPYQLDAVAAQYRASLEAYACPA